MTKRSFVTLGRTYRHYLQLHESILNVLNVVDNENFGNIISPIREAFYIIFDEENNCIPEENRDFILEVIEDIIFDGQTTISKDELIENNINPTFETKEITIKSFGEVYDYLIEAFNSLAQEKN